MMHFKKVPRQEQVTKQDTWEAFSERGGLMGVVEWSSNVNSFILRPKDDGLVGIGAEAAKALADHLRYLNKSL